MDFNFNITLRGRVDLHLHASTGLAALITQAKEEIIMSTAEQFAALQAKLDEQTAALTTATAKVEEGNGKVDALILGQSQVIDTLIALRDAANQGGNVTAADITAAMTKVQASIDKANSITTSVAAQETETDAAVAAGAGALTPPATP